jgi:hypothetical protein
MNGDHAEFEAEHADTPPHERPDWPLPSFDAQDWSASFNNRFVICDLSGVPVDDPGGLMVGWFANALMRGFDEAQARMNEITD